MRLRGASSSAARDCGEAIEPLLSIRLATICDFCAWPLLMKAITPAKTKKMRAKSLRVLCFMRVSRKALLKNFAVVREIISHAQPQSHEDWLNLSADRGQYRLR